MSAPTRADLAAEVEKLTRENQGLRDMLAAVSECARTVPLAAGAESGWLELSRARTVLGAIRVVADPALTWGWAHASGEAAEHLRQVAAIPPGYEAYEPAPLKVSDETAAQAPAVAG